MRPHTHDALPDLRDLDVERVQVQGTHYLPNDRERQRSGDRLYVLRRQPRRRDPHAIAVFADGRGVGFIPSARAAVLSPLLEELGGAAVVNGLGSSGDSVRLWLELPTESALRDYVSTVAAA